MKRTTATSLSGSNSPSQTRSLNALKKLAAILLLVMVLVRVFGHYNTRRVPRDKPLVGAVELQTERGRSVEFVMVPICNREIFPFYGTVYALDNMNEIDTHGMITRPADGEDKGATIIQEITAESGTYAWLTLCLVRKQRKQPVHLRLRWRCGLKSGDNNFTIAPKRANKPDSVNRLKECPNSLERSEQKR